MIPDELKQVLGSITADGKMDFRDGATEGQIEMFEKENGIPITRASFKGNKVTLF